MTRVTRLALVVLAFVLLGADRQAQPDPMPPRLLRSLAFSPDSYNPKQTRVATDLLLGDLLFHSPMTLGAKARAAGLSCDTCHPNGATHRTFFDAKLSDRRGNVDLSTAHFRAGADNHRVDPVNIPSLRGVRFTAPYGWDGRVASLSEFAHGVVRDEFGGKPLSPRYLSALTRYLLDLEFLPNRLIDQRGGLTVAAGDEARRGEELFRRPFDGFAGKSCASCHQPSTYFRDGRVHMLGSGERAGPHAIEQGFETPTLLGLTESAPYFHDGRFETLEAVLSWFDTEFALGLSAEQQGDLLAYVRAVGAVDLQRDRRPFAIRIIDRFVYLELLLSGEAQNDRPIWMAAVDQALQALDGQSPPEALAPRVEHARTALLRVRSAVRDAEPLAPLRPTVRGLTVELPRLAADWAGALARNR